MIQDDNSRPRRGTQSGHVSDRIPESTNLWLLQEWTGRCHKVRTPVLQLETRLRHGLEDTRAMPAEFPLKAKSQCVAVVSQPQSQSTVGSLLRQELGKLLGDSLKTEP